VLKVVSIVTPDGIGTDQENAAYSEQSYLGSDHLIVHSAQRHDCKPPEEILGSHNFIKDNEQPCLEEQGKE